MKILLTIIFIFITNLVLSQQYENLIKFEEGNFLNGYKNANGDTIVKPIYNIASAFNKGLALVSNDKGWTIINNKGKPIFKPGSYFTGPIYGDLDYKLIPVKKNNKWGFINRKGKLVINLQYEDVEDFNEGLAPVKLKGKWGFIDKNDDLIIEPNFKNTRLFYNGLAAVEINDKWGFINKKGEIVIKPKYTSVGWFSEGLCAVNTSSLRWANGGFATEVINKKDEVIFTGQFYSFYGYSDGVAYYWEGYHNSGSKVYIDRKGNVIKKE